MFTEEEMSLVRYAKSRGYIAFLSEVWREYPRLKLNEVSEKARLLWNARKAWLRCLEPTLESLNRDKNECSACTSENTCVEEHMTEGCCLYTFALESGIIEPFERHEYPPLPPSPPSEEEE
jgi:hypothetical protein